MAISNYRYGLSSNWFNASAREGKNIQIIINVYNNNIEFINQIQFRVNEGSTFGDLKTLIQDFYHIPIDKQRLIWAGLSVSYDGQTLVYIGNGGHVTCLLKEYFDVKSNHVRALSEEENVWAAIPEPGLVFKCSGTCKCFGKRAIMYPLGMQCLILTRLPTITCPNYWCHKNLVLEKYGCIDCEWKRNEHDELKPTKFEEFYDFPDFKNEQLKLFPKFNNKYSLPKTIFYDKDDHCSVCLETFIGSLVYLDCGHLFHLKCIKDMYNTSKWKLSERTLFDRKIVSFPVKCPLCEMETLFPKHEFLSFPGFTK